MYLTEKTALSDTSPRPPPDKAIQGVYAEAFKGTEFKKGIDFVLRPLLLNRFFCQIFVLGKLKPASSSGLNFRKNSPCISEFKI